MHDTRLEDSLRRALHEEADALPFTITVDDLNVRLAQRPRPVSRLGILSAAAAVVIVVGVGAFLANQGPNSGVGNSPRPSPSPEVSLDSFEDMVAFIEPAGIEVLRGEFLDGAPGDHDIVTSQIGRVATAGFYQVLYDCSGPGPFTIAWHEPGTSTILTSIELPNCDDTMAAFTSPEQPADALLTISTGRATSWRVLAYEPNADLPELDLAAMGWNLEQSVDVGSDHKQPLTGSIGNRIEIPVGNLIRGRLIQFAMVCLGQGKLQFWISPDGSTEPHMGSEAECNGHPEYTELTPPTDAPYQVWIAVDGRTAWHLIAGVPSGSSTSPGPLGGFAEVENATVLDELSGGPGAASAQLDLPVPAGTDDILTLVMCSGGGELRVFDGTSTHVTNCDNPNTSTLFSSVPPAAGFIPFTAEMTIDGSWAIRFLAQDLESDPDLEFIPPTARLAGPTGDPVASVTACGLGFELADGSTAADSCAPVFPIVPLDRAIHVGAGSELTFELGDGWLITGLTGTQLNSGELIAVDGTGVEFAPLVDADGGPSATVTFAAPAVGDWMVKLSTSAARGGDIFSVPYMFRVIVEP